MKDSTRTPHVDPAWAEAFIVELRILDVRGDRIGAALAEVEAHCADSGESAHEAFGEPVAYARALGLPTQGARFTLREVLRLGAGLVGLFLVVYGTGAWGNRGRVEVTVGMLVALVLVGVALAVVLLRPARVMRAVVDRPWLLVLANVATVGCCAALLVVLDASLLSLPPLAVAAAGALLVVWETVENLRARAAGTDQDPVVGPEGPGGVGTLEPSRALGVLETLGPWTMAIAAVVLGLLGALPRLL